MSCRLRSDPLDLLCPTRTALLALGLLLAAGCTSGGDSSSSTPACPLPHGDYLRHYEKISGTCANTPPDSVVSLDKPLSSACTGNYQVAPDGCSVDVDLTCTWGEDAGVYYVREVGSLRGTSTDLSVLAGSEDVTLTGTVQCAGTYLITLTRQ